MRIRSTTAIALSAALTSAASGQWDPANGDWLKSDATDLRVMTWNMLNCISSNNSNKFVPNGFNNWNAAVRIVAGLQPDVLILQECGDGDGVATLETQCDLFLYGGGGVTDFVTGYAPGYDLPFVMVSGASDGFNRNVIMSRYPFADINGDGMSEFSDVVMIADLYQSGGNGGIRGFQNVEIDLPDATYAGDVAIGNSHFKAGGSGSDFNDRVRASQNIAYFIDHLWNGAGTGVSDPNSKIVFPGAPTNVLDADTPVIWGGDINQSGYGTPVNWLRWAQVFGGTDGTDRDRTDSTADTASQPISGETSTQGSSKLDYLFWQDSIATARRQFIFRSSGSGMNNTTQLATLLTFPIQPLSASGLASDHRPVIVDFILPLAPPGGCSAADLAEPFGDLDFFDVLEFLSLFDAMDPAADLAAPFGAWDFFDVLEFLSVFDEGCP